MAALIISTIAATVSAVSLTVAILAFRRDRPNVKVALIMERHGGREAPDTQQFLLHLTVRNRGSKAVQVDTRRFESDGSSGEWGVKNYGPQLPLVLDGYHVQQWWIDVRHLIAVEADGRRIRARIGLGSGIIVTSDWMSIHIYGTPDTQEEFDEYLKTTPPDEPPRVVW